eukprot:scaffold26369_cov39-Attheya_sp.AAC.1
MAPSTPTMTPNVTPLRSRLADGDNRKRKAIATLPRPTPPRTGDLCLRHSGARDVKRPSYVHCWAVGVGYVLLGSFLLSSSAIKRGSAASSMLPTFRRHCSEGREVTKIGTRSDRRRRRLISGSGSFPPRFFVSAVRLERRSPLLGYIGHAMRAALFLDRFGAIEFISAAAADWVFFSALSFSPLSFSSL